MRRILASLVCGFVFFFGTAVLLMELGLRRYDNYEYYGLHYPALHIVSGVVGLLLPFIVSWLRRRKGRNGGT